VSITKALALPSVSAIDDIRRKLARGKDHLDALAADVREVVEKHEPTLRAEHNPIDDSLSAIIENVPVIPREWGIVLGDFLHNTRSALDHLVCALVAAAGATPGMNHQFPICDTDADWVSRVGRPPRPNKWLGHVDQAHISAIEALQPYQATTGLPSLLTLRRFSNADKHRLIHGAVINTTARPRLTGVWAVPIRVVPIRGFDLEPDTRLVDGTRIMRYRNQIEVTFNAAGEVEAPGADHRMHLGLKLTTAFGEVGNEDTRIRDFRKCLVDVTHIVEQFVPAL
jgi:hypothetical protein